MGFSKYGISYNIFDGEELLEDSILQIRDLVDYISVVYQRISNFGNPCNDDLLDLLLDLKDDGLINEIQEFQPMNYGYGVTHMNELTKRNMGIQLSRKNFCTHHMTMDSDEFYLKDEFQKLIKWHTDNPNYVSYCGLINYYKTSEYVIDEPDNTHVSLFFPIKDRGVVFGMQSPAPVLVDPTRRPICSNTHVFDSEFILMHHMTMVRKDVTSKLINSSAKINYERNNFIQEIIDYYNNWDSNTLIGMNTRGRIKLRKITPKFELKNYSEY